MRTILVATVAIIVIAFGASSVLGSLELSSENVYQTSSARTSD